MEKQLFKEADYNAQLEQMRINYNEPVVINLNAGKFKLRPITSAIQDKISKYLIQQVEIEDSKPADLIAKLRPNVKLQCKAISLAILNDPRIGILNWIKINFFHFIYWRLVFWSFNSSDINDIITHIIDKLGLVFFFQNTTSTRGINSLSKKMTKAERKEVESSLQEPE